MCAGSAHFVAYLATDYSAMRSVFGFRALSSALWRGMKSFSKFVTLEFYGIFSSRAKLLTILHLDMEPEFQVSLFVRRDVRFVDFVMRKSKSDKFNLSHLILVSLGASIPVSSVWRLHS